MLHHYKVNVIGTVLFFQAVLPLLQKSKNPKFVAMGSSAGQITEMEKVPFPNSVYGVTKAALNYIVKKIHLEHVGIIVFPLDPGLAAFHLTLLLNSDTCFS
jgi:norsolorinic acid ketoreductase